MKSNKLFWTVLKGASFGPVAAFVMAWTIDAHDAHAAPPTCKKDPILGEQLFDEGNKLVQEKQYADAIRKFLASECADHASGTLYNLGNAYELDGQLASAWKTFTSVVYGESSSYQKPAKERADALKPRLNQLTLVIPESLSSIANVEVLVDGETVPTSSSNALAYVNQGTRTVTAKAPGRITWSRQTHAFKREQDIETIVLPTDLPLVQKPPIPKQRIVALAVGGVGVAAGIAAIVTGGLAKGYEADAWKACTNNEEPNPDACPKGSSQWFTGGKDSSIKERPQTLMNRALDYEGAAIPLSIISGTALVVGTMLWFTTPTTPKNDTTFRFVPYAGPGNAGATFHFAF